MLDRSIWGRLGSSSIKSDIKPNMAFAEKACIGIESNEDYIKAFEESSQTFLEENASGYIQGKKNYNEQLSVMVESTDLSDREVVAVKLDAINEGYIKDSYEKLKAAIKKLWEKVKGLFEKFKEFLSRYFMDATKFAEKYGDKVIEIAADLNPKFSFEMYQWNVSELKSNKLANNIEMLKDKTKSSISASGTNNIQNKKFVVAKDLKKEFFGILCGKGENSPIKEDKFAKPFTAIYRSTSKKTAKASKLVNSASDMIDFMKEYKEIETNVKDLSSETDDYFQDLLDALDELAEKVSDGDDAEFKQHRAGTGESDFRASVGKGEKTSQKDNIANAKKVINSSSTAMNSACGLMLNLIKDCVKEFKGCTGAILTAGKKKDK